VSRHVSRRQWRRFDRRRRRAGRSPRRPRTLRGPRHDARMGVERPARPVHGGNRPGFAL